MMIMEEVMAEACKTGMVETIDLALERAETPATTSGKGNPRQKRRTCLITTKWKQNENVAFVDKKVS